jgi:uncharacterized protein YhbP (UPF0306 family)
MDETISRFLKNQTCTSISCVDETGKAYCFSCFYVFNEEEKLLYYKSSAETNHSLIIKKNPVIAGTVLPDKLNKLVVKGIQFEGVVLEHGDNLAQGAAEFYHKKNPLALAIPGKVWTIEIRQIKMTDSTLGFGKKISWER